MRGWRKLLHAFQSRGGGRGGREGVGGGRGGGEGEGDRVARERVWGVEEARRERVGIGIG